MKSTPAHNHVIQSMHSTIFFKDYELTTLNNTPLTEEEKKKLEQDYETMKTLVKEFDIKILVG